MTPSLPAVAAALEAGLAEGIAPALSLAVRRGGALVHLSCHGAVPAPAPPMAGLTRPLGPLPPLRPLGPLPPLRPLGPGDLFDVASLTKVICTATLAAQAVGEGALDLDAPAARWLPGFARGGKGGVTVRHLLAHTSGLPAWRPWHEPVAADPQAGPLFAPPDARPPPAALGQAITRGRALVQELLEQAPLEAPPGARARYSDPGFIALGLVLERALGAPLAALFQARVAGPLGLAATGFLDPLAPRPRLSDGRGVAPARDSAPRGVVAHGEVDDDTAWAMGGVAGHAGLFSTAAEVAAVGQAWLDALPGRPSIVPGGVARRFAARDASLDGPAGPGSTRALGWDTPSPEGSTLGSRLGRGPQGAIGHLGFTGCSLWLDLDEGVAVALLTNHVHPSGPDRTSLTAFRRRVHDAVAGALGIGGAAGA